MNHDDDQDAQLLDDLRLAVHQLADRIADLRPVAAALRRFAATLPHVPMRQPPTHLLPRPLRPLLYEALAAGAVDARTFNRGMLVVSRAKRARSYWPPEVTGSPSSS